MYFLFLNQDEVMHAIAFETEQNAFISRWTSDNPEQDLRPIRHGIDSISVVASDWPCAPQERLSFLRTMFGQSIRLSHCTVISLVEVAAHIKKEFPNVHWIAVEAHFVAGTSVVFVPYPVLYMRKEDETGGLLRLIRNAIREQHSLSDKLVPPC